MNTIRERSSLTGISLTLMKSLQYGKRGMDAFPLYGSWKNRTICQKALAYWCVIPTQKDFIRSPMYGKGIKKLYWKFRNPADVPLSDREAVAQYEEEMEAMRREYHKFTDTKTKPAGRKPHPEKLDEKAQKIRELSDKGLKEKEITEMLGIGRATYYRLKEGYLATFEVTKKWTMPIRNWGRVRGELSIMYPGRLSD